MKTIYTRSGKYIIDDEMLALTDKAVQRVDELSKEEDWVPSFEIYIPFTRYLIALEGRKDMQPTGQIIIKVKKDSDVEDSSPEVISRFLHGQMPTEGIKVDLGEYGHEGWQSLIDYCDLRELSDFYFAGMFAYSIIEETISATDLPNLKEVENDHWNNLAEKICKEAERNLRRYDVNDTISEIIERAKRLKSASTQFLVGEMSLEELIKAIEEVP